MAFKDTIGRYVLMSYEQQPDGDVTERIIGVFADLWLAKETAKKSEWNLVGRGTFEIEVFDPLDYPRYQKFTLATEKA